MLPTKLERDKVSKVDTSKKDEEALQFAPSNASGLR